MHNLQHKQSTPRPVLILLHVRTQILLRQFLGAIFVSAFLLRKVIEKRLKSKGVVTPAVDEDEATPENATTNVVDFMALLQKSLANKKRTPAKKATAKPARKRL